MTEFHFLRPLWLLLLPLAAWAAWRVGMGRGGRDGWRAVVDKALQPFVLAAGESFGQRRWPLMSALAATAIGAVALAGPTWDRLPVPAFRSEEALVVALDLSRSMDAADVEPTRLARAKLKLLDLLERREGGQTALVVFTSNAFTVTPLTNDTRTIAALVHALGSDIMPSQGSAVEVGLDKAATLLRQSAGRGEILVITDAVASPAAFDLAAELDDAGIAVHVLGVGTAEGAPIPNRDGGFLTDASGQVVVPRLNVDNLRRLAAAGGGRYASLVAGDSDLDRLFPDATAGGVLVESGEDRREIEVWRDQGIWLTLALLPLIALAFRRGWVYVVVIASMLPVPRAEALGWRDLWQRPDQQGVEALRNDEPAEAAALFEDPEWAAAASYRAGQFDASAAALAGIDRPDAHYNRGNALARSGKLAEAIDAYDRALELAPDHADAEFNRELVAELLDQQQQQQQQQQQSGQEQQDQSGEGGEPQSSEEQAAQANPGEGEAEQDPELANQNSATPSAPGQSRPQTDQGDEAPPEPTEANERGEQPVPGDQPLQAAATPEEIEDWASEQAAEQWLRRIPQDPGGLLRRKFLYQYQQYGIDQDGNRIFAGTEVEPW